LALRREELQHAVAKVIAPSVAYTSVGTVKEAVAQDSIIAGAYNCGLLPKS